MKTSGAVVKKELRRLGIGNAAADVADGIVDVPVGKDQIERAVQIEVGEKTSKAERVARGGADNILGNVSRRRDRRIPGSESAGVDRSSNFRPDCRSRGGTDRHRPADFAAARTKSDFTPAWCLPIRTMRLTGLPGAAGRALEPSRHQAS